ncbi:GNAT family N-acetyltransferase [Phytomonospora sp. NPDC050363]|uniref:GNAT family N-acetyltransferase n=1 Tax=Phytomonospora sp. NPDC050363 TaxID=3155642 RepID=UPI0033E911B3
MLIRSVTPQDTSARVKLIHACVDFAMVTAEMIDSAPVNPATLTRRWVAEIDGDLVATAMAELAIYDGAGAAKADVMVAPEHRGTGIGTALLQKVDGHLKEIGARLVTSHAFDEIGVRFAERNGFTAGRRTRVSKTDPERALPMAVPSDIKLLAVSELPDLRAAHEVALAFGPDIPSDTPYVALPYDKWVAARHGNARLALDCSFLAFADEIPVAFTLTEIIGDRMISLLTGTRPGYRQRGLASLIKAAALSTAATRGVRHAYTFNDTENVAMLAVNDKFGYRPDTVARELTRVQR